MPKNPKETTPSFRTVNIDLDLYAKLEEDAERLELPVKDYVARKLKSDGKGRVSQEREIEAYILKRLDPEQVRLMKECCIDTGTQPISYILSYCQRMYEIGETSFIEHEQVSHQEARAALQEIHYTCGHCHKDFVSQRVGQKYCSYECGKAVDVAAMHATRPRERQDDPRAFAPPQHIS